MWKRAIATVVAVCLILLLVSQSGRLLIKDQPAKSEVILVLAGETERRPELGLQLLDAGFASKLILDVPARTKIYRWSQPELAQLYVDQLAEKQAISICSIHGLSTKAEAEDASTCLRSVGAQTVLLVTSDFHTRRALSVFQRELPGYSFSTAAAHDPKQFGVQWWKNREWAKTNLYEWMRIFWWNVVDRWM